ncbi:MAG TPA: phosphonate ABC transporter, permease protein PhnE, partial [Methylophaga sp.]|nr:phosphonate ABC transporter, permease protein PhnE [Methylophaga sp.]
MTTHVLEQSEALKRYSQRWKKQTLQVMALLAIILLAAWYVDVLNFELLANGLPAIGTLASESFPPDFTHLRDWFSPLLDTLAMSIAG